MMGQDNNGLTISGMSAAQGGLIRGTDEGDVINVTATNTARATFEFDLRDNDNQTDNLSFGTAIAAAVGPTLVKIYDLTVLPQELQMQTDLINCVGSMVQIKLLLP